MITNQWFCGLADDARMIREKVFVEEQGFPPEEEFDVFDGQAARGACITTGKRSG